MLHGSWGFFTQRQRNSWGTQGNASQPFLIRNGRELCKPEGSEKTEANKRNIGGTKTIEENTFIFSLYRSGNWREELEVSACLVVRSCSGAVCVRKKEKSLLYDLDFFCFNICYFFFIDVKKW